MNLCRCCRCCLDQIGHKDLFSKNYYLDKEEVYSVMILDCFGIEMNVLNVNKICESCISHLRESSKFKEQILKSERKLMKILELKDESEEIVKKEVIEDFVNENETDFLTDTYYELEPNYLDEHPKKRKATKEKLTKTRSISKEQPHTNEKNSKRKLVINVDKLRKPKKDTTKIVVIKKERTPRNNKTRIIKIEKRPIKVRKLTYCTKGELRSHTKMRHLHNLQTILNFSNAVPFKNKTLLGYICGYCDKYFQDPLDLRYHTEQIHKEERLNILQKFDISSLTVKLDIMNLKCTLCQENIEDLKVLKEHLVGEHGKKFHTRLKDHILQFRLQQGDKYDCALCPSSHETFKMLKQHMNVHYNNYMCKKCGTPFITWNALRAHEDTHIDGSFKCEHCDKVFTSHIRKKSHEKLMHKSRSLQKCPQCEEPFKSYYHRNQHMVKVHNSEMRYKCNVCSKGFLLKTILMNHIKRSHLMERNYKCTECDHTFFTKQDLSNHMVKHTGEKMYQCEVCTKSYGRKKTLREHMRIHNNDRRFKCEVCLMTFVQKCSLKSHLLSNHGISLLANDVSCPS